MGLAVAVLAHLQAVLVLQRDRIEAAKKDTTLNVNFNTTPSVSN